LCSVSGSTHAAQTEVVRPYRSRAHGISIVGREDHPGNMPPAPPTVLFPKNVTDIEGSSRDIWKYACRKLISHQAKSLSTPSRNVYCSILRTFNTLSSYSLGNYISRAWYASPLKKTRIIQTKQTCMTTLPHGPYVPQQSPWCCDLLPRDLSFPYLPRLGLTSSSIYRGAGLAFLPMARFRNDTTVHSRKT